MTCIRFSTPVSFPRPNLLFPIRRHMRAAMRSSSIRGPAARTVNEYWMATRHEKSRAIAAHSNGITSKLMTDQTAMPWKFTGSYYLLLWISSFGKNKNVLRYHHRDNSTGSTNLEIPFPSCSREFWTGLSTPRCGATWEVSFYDKNCTRTGRDFRLCRQFLTPLSIINQCLSHALIKKLLVKSVYFSELATFLSNLANEVLHTNHRAGLNPCQITALGRNVLLWMSTVMHHPARYSFTIE